MKYQIGRSMVEMLGTLSIMGILSIGSIGGINYMMAKHHVNTTLQDLNLRHTDLIRQNAQNRVLSLDEWRTQKTFYPIELVQEMTPTLITMRVSNVPQKECEMILREMEKIADISVNGVYPDEVDAPVCLKDNAMNIHYGFGDRCDGKHCEEGTICLSNNKRADNPGYNACKKYDIVKRVNIDGREWLQIEIDGTGPSWWDLEGVCAHLGKSMPTVYDFIETWDGSCEDYGSYDGNSCGTRTELSNRIFSEFDASYIWTSNDYSASNKIFIHEWWVGNNPKNYGGKAYTGLCR